MKDARGQDTYQNSYTQKTQFEGVHTPPPYNIMSYLKKNSGAL